MLVNAPHLLYNRHHHPLWIFRRLTPNPKSAVVFIAGSVFLLYIITDKVELDSDLGVRALFFTTLALMPLGRLALVLVDWRTRNIRLYSDGRLDYVSGIFHRRGQSVSTRFGFIQYRYPSSFRVWLDCADLILPFDAGMITDIPDFKQFWDIAQGRV
jgi:hypothetical protein